MNEHGKYGFEVEKSANKIQIKNEVEKVYGVTVESVNTMVHSGRMKRRHTKSRIIEGRIPAYKKAIVKVAGGDIIDFYGI